MPGLVGACQKCIQVHPEENYWKSKFHLSQGGNQKLARFYASSACLDIIEAGCWWGGGLYFCLCLFVFVFFVCLSFCLFLCLDIIEGGSHSLCEGRVGSMAAPMSPLLKHNGPLLCLKSPIHKQGSLFWLDLDSFGWILMHGRNVPFWANQ